MFKTDRIQSTLKIIIEKIWFHKRRNLFLLSTAFILLLLSVVYSYFFKTEEVADREVLPNIKVTKVIKRNLKNEIVLPGSITYKEKAAITPKYSGRVENIYVKLGDRVKAGQVLAELEKRDLVLQEKKVSSSVQAAKVNLDISRSSLRQETRDKEKKYQDLNRARTDILSAKTSFFASKRNFSNKLDLYKIGGISFVSLQDSYTEYLKSMLDYYKTRKNIEINEIGFRPEDLQKAGLTVPKNTMELEKALIDMNTESSQKGVEASEVQYKSAMVERDTIRNMIQETKLKSPINGVLAERSIDIGESVTTEKSVFIIVYTDELYIDVNIPESNIMKIKKNATVDVTFKNFDKHYSLPIDIISPIIDPTNRTFQIKLLLVNDEGLFRPGMYASCKFTLDEAENVLSIPEESILTELDTEKNIFL